MKPIITLLIALSFLGKLTAQQFYINEIFKHYFRVNPLGIAFNNFFRNLNADPALSKKILHKRTDSTLFSFTGSYETYKKAGLNVTHANIRLEEMAIDLEDSLHTRDTLMQYQITYYCDDGKNKGTAAKNEYDRFYREYRDGFTNRELKGENEKAGAIRHFFSYNLPVSPVTTVWRLGNENESIYSVAVRLKLKENMLDLYTGADLKQVP